MKRLAIILALACLAGCDRRQGDKGMTGVPGPSGQSGITLAFDQTFGLPGGGTLGFNVPGLAGADKHGWVNVYYQVASLPNEWFPMTDGWTDPPTDGSTPVGSRVSSVDFVHGIVYVYYMAPGDKIRIQFWEVNS